MQTNKKQQQQQQRIIVNYIPISVINTLKNQFSEYSDYISNLRLPIDFSGDLHLFFIFRGILYTLLGYNP